MKAKGIDITNYISFFIDFVENELDIHQVEELNRFILQYPYLKSELEDLQKAKLVPEPIVFAQKHNLIKASAYDSTESNDINNLSIAHLEKDISEEQKQTLDKLRRQSKEQERIFQAIQSLKLEPNLSEGFKKKSKLKRSAIGRLTQIQARYAASIAAGFTLLILGGSYLWYASAPIQIPQMIVQETVSTSEEVIGKEPLEERQSLQTTKTPKLASKEIYTAQVKTATNSEHEVAPRKREFIEYIEPIKVGSILFKHKSAETLVFANHYNTIEGEEVGEDHIQPSKRVLTTLDLLVVGLNKLYKEAEPPVLLSTQRDKEGKLTRYSIETSLFAISLPVRNRE